MYTDILLDYAQRGKFAMDENRLGLMEGRFADIIWQSAPISTGNLVKNKIGENRLRFIKGTALP